MSNHETGETNKDRSKQRFMMVGGAVIVVVLLIAGLWLLLPDDNQMSSASNATTTTRVGASNATKTSPGASTTTSLKPSSNGTTSGNSKTVPSVPTTSQSPQNTTAPSNTVTTVLSVPSAHPTTFSDFSPSPSTIYSSNSRQNDCTAGSGTSVMTVSTGGTSPDEIHLEIIHNGETSTWPVTGSLEGDFYTARVYWKSSWMGSDPSTVLTVRFIATSHGETVASTVGVIFINRCP